jgi:NAD(P)-dependent dehydrogenase (short-subunit alcohol dehydrogenase family)
MVNKKGMLMKIQDNLFIVTGGCSGLGAAVCQHLEAKGGKIGILDLAQKIPCDVSKEDDVKKALDHIIQTHQQTPRGLINCAGIVAAQRMVGKEGPAALEWFEKVIRINLIGTFNVMRLVAEQMMKASPIEEERGIIINTASIAAFDGQIGQSAYSASKGGIVAMTLPLAREMAAMGIRVMTIAPGIMDTPMSQGMSERLRTSLLAQTVFPKRLGRSSEFAALVEHIISNPLLNGEVIRLDGGVRLY